MSRAKGSQQIIHPTVPELPPQMPWNRVLDACVMQHFHQQHVICATGKTSRGKWVTLVKHKNGSTLTPALMKRVDAFVAGFMACEESYTNEV